MPVRTGRRANWVKLKEEMRWGSIIPSPYHRWLTRKYKTEGKEFSFTVHDAIDEIENFDMEKLQSVRQAHSAYAKAIRSAQTVFRKHRDMIPLAAQLFVLDGQHQEYVNAEYDLEQIWERFNDAMLSNGIIPVLSDADDDHNYKLIDAVDYIDHLESVARRGLSTVRRVGIALRDATQALPQIGTKFVRPIADDHEHLALDWPDRFLCPHCQNTYAGEENYEKHLRERHPEEIVEVS